ncbi:Heme oxygenase [Thiohalospira halophila DSM 15071]|uniref:Heme oxygenase n=1 Tax=Thiohalospira halophila DSM 15071 TaxID=1123397 RepID=A0A1I1NWC9_9GAMM|nr:biliverdin-producing heme oxygenase [Thiohalospira halophila]SFD01632.1 Heme oxygenase [Thiohalospira halophila DSM 15071]
MQTETGAMAAETLPDTDVRSLLRDATAELHADIEASAVVRRVMADTVTEADYRHLLARLHGFHRPLETGLNDFCTRTGEERPYQRRVVRLERDLRARGIDPDDLPRSPDAPRPHDRAQLLGITWVLEGSALGAQVIRRHLEARLGPAVIGPFHAAEGPAAWRSFLARLEGEVRSPGEREAALRGARVTFAGLLQWLQEAGA